MMRYLPVFLFLVGCPSDDAVTDTDEPMLTWQEMDFDERSAYMSSTVLPAMTAEFAALDPSFADMNCGTCHGPGATDGTFSMPSTGLAAIDVADFPTGPVADFMGATVVPTMADLLDQEPFDPATGEGFGCFGCHPSAM